MCNGRCGFSSTKQINITCGAIHYRKISACADGNEDLGGYMKLSSTLIAVAVLMLAACSTTPITQQSARPVPSERIHEVSYVGPATDASEATVVFLRDSGGHGSACTHDIYVNTTKVFSIRQGEQITLRIPAGQHFFRLESGGGLCPNISTSQESILSEGARQVYRILLPSDSSLRLTRIE